MIPGCIESHLGKRNIDILKCIELFIVTMYDLFPSVAIVNVQSIARVCTFSRNHYVHMYGKDYQMIR